LQSQLQVAPASALEEQLPGAVPLRRARRDERLLRAVAAQVQRRLRLPLGARQVARVVRRPAPHHDLHLRRDAGVEHQPVPDAVGDATVERRPRAGGRRARIVGGADRGVQVRRRGEARPALRHQRDPAVGEVVVRLIARRHQPFAAEQPHGQVVGLRLQDELSIGQRRQEEEALVAVLRHDVQAIRHRRTVRRLGLGNEGEILGGHIEMADGPILDQVRGDDRRHRVAELLPEPVARDERVLLGRVVVEDQHRPIGQRFNGNRVAGSQRRGGAEANARGEGRRKWEPHHASRLRLECVRRRGRDRVGLVAGDHPELAVQRPVAGVDPVENPDAAARRRGHVERHEGNSRRPVDLPRRPAGVQVEQQQPRRVEDADDQVMLLGNSQAGQRQGRRHSGRVERLETAEARGGGTRQPVAGRPEVAGVARPRRVRQ
jgi:hypothetical protein